MPSRKKSAAEPTGPRTQRKRAVQPKKRPTASSASPAGGSPIRETEGIDVERVETDASVIETAIGARAYEIWIEEGQPEGRAEEHWIRAELELSEGNR